MGMSLFQRIRPIVRKQNLVLAPGQKAAERLGSIEVIVDDEDAERVRLGFVDRSGWGDDRWLSGGEAKTEGAAEIRPIAIGLDGAAVQFGELLHDGETDAETALAAVDGLFALRKE